MGEHSIPKAQGFFYNRLFGIFVDPNFAATTSVLLLFASIYQFRMENTKAQKTIWIVNMILQLIYILLSSSRTGLVLTLVGFVIYLWLTLRIYFNEKSIPNGIKLFFCLVISIIGIMAGLFMMRFLLEKLPNTIMKNIRMKNQDGYMEEITLDRTDLEGKGVSNLRFELWGDCLQIVKSKPILGTSPRNLIPYAKEYYKGTYPAKGYDFGSGYIAVITGTGIVGTIVVCLFIANCIRKVVKYVWHFQYDDYQNRELNVFSLTIIGIMALEAFLNYEIFLINSFNTAFFWLMLGYLMEQINEKIRVEEKKDANG